MIQPASGGTSRHLDETKTVSKNVEERPTDISTGLGPSGPNLEQDPQTSVSKGSDETKLIGEAVEPADLDTAGSLLYLETHASEC